MAVRVATILLLGLGSVLYAAMIGSLAGGPHSDAAGRGMAMGFGVIFAAALWLVLAVLTLMAGRARGLPSWRTPVAVLLVPLSGVAAFMAIDLYFDRQAWALWVAAILPPLLALHALWPPTGALLTAAIAVFSLAPIAVGISGMLPDPARDARMKAQQEEAANRAREALEREAAEFASLGPESSLAAYLPYLHSGTYGDRALAGIQIVKSRQSDAVALLTKAPLADLADLWQFNLVPTRELCAAYANALSAAGSQITRARSDYISAAIEIEWQLPNLKWLIAAKCDLHDPLERAETHIRAVADSPRLTNFADTLADIRARTRP